MSGILEKYNPSSGQKPIERMECKTLIKTVMSDMEAHYSDMEIVGGEDFCG